MKVNKLHPRNPHHGPYDLAILSDANPALKQHIIQNPKGEDTINFFEAEAVLELNKALLYQNYQIDHWTIPKGYLCPPIPGRADYIHYLADLINGEKDVNCLDIGTGANCIYPIIGCSEYNWNFVGSELDQKAFDNALKIIERNSALKHKINLRKQVNAPNILRNIIREGEYFHLSLCNPPFHASEAEANKGSQRKLNNLKKTKNTALKLNFGGQKNELWTKGGELHFIMQYIQESMDFQAQVKWFTCLVSKKENLEKLLARCKKLGSKEVRTIEMNQGQKTSRFIAWRYH